ncbi:SCO family protein [Lichenihabitans sp. Uapishka_5]|nr:SCO family protein [Lichenihabitans sp. Uapishka_5]MDX7953506.1 SCO family protein [Lichenihabitans sp. Uapishka_5]
MVLRQGDAGRGSTGFGGPAAVGGAFALTDQDGHPATEALLRGEPTLVFFGYTHCPDVCPTTLSDLSAMFRVLGQDAKAQALFITVDPWRDTPAVLKDYLSNFDPRIRALTGSPDAVAAVERAYKVYVKKVPTAGGDYAMDHTALVYLMDKDGRFVNGFNLSQSPEKAAADLAASL